MNPDAAAPADDDEEHCLLCAETGPPPTASAQLRWIGCTKGGGWFHSACVLRDATQRDTLPGDVVEAWRAAGEEAWFDWPGMVDKWYCHQCVAFSTSPENPRPPRQPLVATVKRSVLERRKRDSDAASTPSKRPRPSHAKAEPSPARPAGADESANGTAEADGAAGPSRPKRQAAKNAPDYANMHNHVPTPTRAWLELIRNPAASGRVVGSDDFPRVPGKLLGVDWLNGKEVHSNFPPTLFYGPDREPLVVRPQDGGIASMGGKVPAPSLTVSDVARLVGPDVKVDVIDVATQQSSSWKLSDWAAYLEPSATAKKVYNIISLEISGTELAKQVRPPRIVSEVDWVDNFWHFKAGKGAEVAASVRAERDVVDGAKKAPKTWPKVQLYCLDSWTDWHVDFAASSVYYHIHTGSKTFFFIRPTDKNLAAYAEWSGSAEMQQSVWLPDMCDGVRKVTLHKGDTMLIPAGYIHAVYTPADSIVFGGNFLHSYDVDTQLRLRQIEIDTKVPQRFRFPSFDKLCWYVAQRHTADLRNLRAYRPSRPTTPPSPVARVLEGLHRLARFLVAQADEIDSPATDDKRRKALYERVPTELVADYAALGRELQWRVEREMPSLVAPAAPVVPVPAAAKPAAARDDKRRRPRQSAPASTTPDVKPAPKAMARVPSQTPPAYEPARLHAPAPPAPYPAHAGGHYGRAPYPPAPYVPDQYAHVLASMALGPDQHGQHGQHGQHVAHASRAPHAASNGHVASHAYPPVPHMAFAPHTPQHLAHHVATPGPGPGPELHFSGHAAAFQMPTDEVHVPYGAPRHGGANGHAAPAHMPMMSPRGQ